MDNSLEGSFRMRRKHSVRMWSVELEADLKRVMEQINYSEVSADGKSAQALKLWEELGHSGFSEAELEHKMNSIERVKAMLVAEPTAKVSDEVSHSSLAEDLQHYEEVVRAIHEEDVGKVTLWAQNDKRTAMLTDALSRTTLHIAADVGCLAIVKALVHAGAPVNHVDHDGNIPLFNALRRGHTEVVEYLLQRGADIKVRNKLGYGALHLACHANDEASVRRLLAAGAEVNIQNDLKQTPLHIASHRATQVICDLLIQNGANADIRDVRGNAPANLARRMSKLSNEKYLLQKMRTSVNVIRAAVRLAKLGAMSPKKKKVDPTSE